jgi:hypothetical protein
MAAIEIERALRAGAILCNSPADGEPRLHGGKPSRFRKIELILTALVTRYEAGCRRHHLVHNTGRKAETDWRVEMPYFIAWLLGVPLTVLVIIYLFMHA